MTIVYRSVKGSRLTSTEIDGNFQDLQNAALLSDRNTDLIINPHGSIQQPGAINASADGQYFADQWAFLMSASGAAAIGAIGSGLSLYDPYYILLRTTTAKVSLAAADYFGCRQPIEGYFSRRLLYGTTNARGSWLQWRANSTGNGVASLSVRNAAGTRSFVHPFTVSTVPTTYSVFIPGDTAGSWLTDNNAAHVVSFTAAAGSQWTTATVDAWQAGNYLAASTNSNMLDNVNRQLNITDISWKPSQILIPFQSIDWDHEIKRCQRYYAQTYDYGTAPGTATGTGSILKLGQGNGGTAVYDTWEYPNNMRIAPTIGFYPTVAGASGNWSDGSNVLRAMSVGGGTGQRRCQFICTTLPSGSYTLLNGHITAVARM